MQIIDVCRTHFPSGTFRKPNLGHGRTPTWRKVTTEIISLSADQTRASLRAARGRKKITVLDFPAGCWLALTAPPQKKKKIFFFFNELSKQRQNPAQVQPSSGLVPGEGEDTSKEKVGFCGYFLIFFPFSLGVAAAGSIRRTQGHLGAEPAGLPRGSRGRLRGNSTSKRSPVGAGARRGGPRAVSGRAGKRGDEMPTRRRGPPPRRRRPRHGARVVQNSCTWGERVNTKKKGTAALLLKI